MDTPFDKGRRYENAIAKAYGKRQPGSGSLSQAKEDVIGTGVFSPYLFQTKNAEGQKSFSVKLIDLENLRRNSSTVGRTGLFFINFGENREYVLLRRKDFDYLISEDKSEGS